MFHCFLSSLFLSRNTAPCPSHRPVVHFAARLVPAPMLWGLEGYVGRPPFIVGETQAHRCQVRALLSQGKLGAEPGLESRSYDYKPSNPFLLPTLP